MTRARDLASGLAGVRPFAMAAGRATGLTNANYTTITFPAGRFTFAPMVTATGDSLGTAAAFYTTSVTTSSFGLASSAGTTNVNAYWIAVQMTSGAGAG